MDGLRYLVWGCTRAEERLYPYTLGDGRPLPDELDTGAARHMFDMAADFGAEYLFITGGEPFLRPDLLELVKYASGRGLRLYLKTGGQAIDRDPDLARYLAECNCQVLIGIDGMEDVDDMLRGKGAHRKSISAALACSRLGILCTLSVLNTKYVVGQIKQLAGLALEVGAKEFSLACLVPQPFCAEEQRTKLVPLEPSAGEHERELNEMYALSKQFGDRVKISPYDIFYNRILKTREPGLKLGNRCCLRTDLEENDWLEVQSDGRVYVCGPLGLSFGDVRVDSFQDIVRRVRGLKVLRELADPANLKGKCGACEFNDICGGCRASAFIHSGDMFAEDPHCAYRRSGPHY